MTMREKTTEELQRVAVRDTVTCALGAVPQIRAARRELARRGEPLFTASIYREWIEEETRPLMDLLCGGAAV